MSMKLALWQGAGVPGDLTATIDETERVAVRAAEQGANLLVFPEGFLTGYYISDLAPGRLPGVEAALTRVAQVAARAGLSLVMGANTEAADRIRNTAVVFSDDGAEVGRYHKRALFGPWEKATFAPGDRPLRFDCDGLRVGVAICYDVEFPELIRAEARAGVDLVVVPTALMTPHERIARMVVPVRALENQIFIGYANRSGTEPGLDFVGLSCICGPRGEALATAGKDSGLIVADLDSAHLASERAENSYLTDLSGLERSATS